MIARVTRSITRSSPWVVACVAVAASALAAAPPALAEAQPHWNLEVRPAPEYLPPGNEAMIVVTATNLGDAEVNGGAGKTVTIKDELPEGVHVLSVQKSTNSISGPDGAIRQARLNATSCQQAERQVTCTFTGTLPPYEILRLVIRASVSANAPAESADIASVSGGGAGEATMERKIKVGNQEPTFGVEQFEMTPETEKFAPDHQAGSHPFQLTTTFNINQGFELTERVALLKWPSAPALQDNLNFRLPAGMIGNVNAVPQCNGTDFGAQGEEFRNSCPNDTVVGVASVSVFDSNAQSEQYGVYVVPVFNLEPGAGEPARFGFSILHVPVTLDTHVRTGEDYGVTVSVHYASEAVQVLGSKVTFWGMPGDERHDRSRGWACLLHVPEREPFEPCGTIQARSTEPFLMLPTSCTTAKGEPSTVETFVSGDAWNGDPLTGPNGETAIGSEHPAALSGCEGLSFTPSVEVEPEKHEASTPTGLDVTVKLPQNGTMEPVYENKAEAAVSSTKLELPVGLEASAGAANGLSACTVGEAGFNGSGADTGGVLGGELEAQSFTPEQASCPESAKIGSVNIRTPLLERELVGGVYLAEQDTDPFASPLVLYLIAEDKAPGEAQAKVLVKLAGEVTINPSNGQLVSDFKNTPQSPFETLEIHLWGGSRASQATPSRCGAYASNAVLTNSSNAVAPEPKSEYQVTSGPGGSPCPGATLPFQPSFQTESANTNAGAYTPFTLRIARPDGDAALRTIDMQLPPGLAAVLASVPLCPESQAAQGTCGPESEIGQSVSYSGLGGTPVRLPGKVYLTGPYNGAPFGLSSVTEANAGPFHLGSVVVRSGIYVNPYTAAATIDTEASQFLPAAPVAGEQTQFSGLPEMLKGIPAQIKELEVTVDRPNFEFNPTNCEKMSVTGSLTGYEGTSAGVSSPFQVGNCGALPFAPKLTATVGGKGSKPNGVTFDVKVESAGIGQANIHKVDLTLPEVLPSRQSTIEKACVEAVFNANPASCDEGSLIGEGIVQTPVFKNPLRGPAYLVSHGAAAFPDVEFVLQGEGIEVILDGKTDIKKGITYSKFETSPDAPFTSFESIFPAGPHSALTSYVPEKEDFSLCNSASKLLMPTEITGQNGAFISQDTKIALTGCSGVLASKAKLTRAQLLAKALKACRTKYKKKKHKRIACEKQARKKYGPKHKKKSSKKGAKKSSHAAARGSSRR